MVGEQRAVLAGGHEVDADRVLPRVAARAILDVHEFNTDGAAISFSKTSDDFAQRLRSGPVKSGAGKELIGSLGGQAPTGRS